MDKPKDPNEKKTVPAAEAAKSTASSTFGPSNETAEAFLRRMFGYNENLAFKVSSVKPTGAEGVSEVTSIVNTPQGQQVSKLFVTPDGKHAISGDMIPFGRDPYAENREILKDAFGGKGGWKSTL